MPHASSSYSLDDAVGAPWTTPAPNPYAGPSPYFGGWGWGGYQPYDKGGGGGGGGAPAPTPAPDPQTHAADRINQLTNLPGGLGGGLANPTTNLGHGKIRQLMFDSGMIGLGALRNEASQGSGLGQVGGSNQVTWADDQFADVEAQKRKFGKGEGQNGQPVREIKTRLGSYNQFGSEIDPVLRGGFGTSPAWQYMGYGHNDATMDEMFREAMWHPTEGSAARRYNANREKYREEAVDKFFADNDPRVDPNAGFEGPLPKGELPDWYTPEFPGWWQTGKDVLGSFGPAVAQLLGGGGFGGLASAAKGGKKWINSPTHDYLTDQFYGSGGWGGLWDSINGPVRPDYLPDGVSPWQMHQMAGYYGPMFGSNPWTRPEQSNPVADEHQSQWDGWPWFGTNPYQKG